MKDIRRKAQGSRCAQAKLTEEEVRRIRRLYKNTDYRVAELARFANVSQPTLSNIINRRSWRHV